MPSSRAVRVVLGVSGGIAAYKAAELCRLLVRDGIDVQVVLTRAAREFVSPRTFAVLSGREVFMEIWTDENRPGVEHVTLADRTDLLIVAPATAHTMARFAHGLADDFLTTYFLSHRGPVLLAPAMESAMWRHPAVETNRDLLAGRGVRFVGPGAGALASGHEGVGRMAEPAEILRAARNLLADEIGDLSGLKILVTAGPTREPIDPVRFVSNRSSGRMGYALAEAARDRGATVTLLTGPTALPRPDGVRVLSFDTSADLHGLLVQEFPECDGLAMAAAVADFIPEQHAERLHRGEGDATLRLAAGKDVLASLRPLRRGQTVVAFAAETEDLERRAIAKRDAKGADMIVVNDVGRSDVGFESPDNEVVILAAGQSAERVSRRPKREVADAIWDAFLAARRRGRDRDGVSGALREVSLGVSGRPPAEGENDLEFFRDIGIQELYLTKTSTAAPALVPGTMRDLPALAQFLAGCPRCKLAPTRTNIVFGQGNPRAELMFVGEAPGRDEDEQGLAFVGRAGQLLTKIIEAIGRTRDDVYIANVLKCRPPNNRNPERDEVQTCKPFLDEQIRLIAPRVIVTLGTFAAQALLETDEPISRMRGQWRSARGVRVMPTFHPAFLLRSPDRKKDVWEDMKLVRDYLAAPAGS